MAKDTIRLHTSLTLCNADNGETESFFLDTIEGEDATDLYAGLSPILRRMADDWDEFIAPHLTKVDAQSQA